MDKSEMLALLEDEGALKRYLDEILPLSIKVPSRMSLVGNPSDIAPGYGMVLSMPLRCFQATVVFMPSDRFYIRGPEESADDLLDAIDRVGRQGIQNGENLFLAGNKTAPEMLAEAGVSPLPAKLGILAYTTIPRQRGLAGSSAFVTGYNKLMIRLHGLENHPAYIPARLAKWVLQVEAQEMGITAGLQDRLVQCYADEADVLYMDMTSEAFSRMGGEFGEYQTLKGAPMPSLALMLSNEPSHSGQLHQGFKTLIDAGDGDALREVQELARYAPVGWEALKNRDWCGLGETMDATADWRIRNYGKAALGDINLKMVEICRKAGCYCNFTGSGGALAVLLPEGKESFDRLMAEIHKAGMEGLLSLTMVN